MSSPIVIKNQNRNVLLIKDDVGRAKQSIYNLPPEGFMFGKAEQKSGINAGMLTRYEGLQ